MFTGVRKKENITYKGRTKKINVDEYIINQQEINIGKQLLNEKYLKEIDSSYSTNKKIDMIDLSEKHKENY